MLLIFSLLPVYNKEVNISWFYKQKQNILDIELKDSQEFVQENLAKIVIKNPLYATKEINLYDNNPNIVINSWDTIIYISKTKNLETIVNLHLWDWSIIRILPQSIVRINKLLKDNEDLMLSKTEIEVQKWNIWFRVIRTIFDKDWFNVKTDNWTIVIRWTAWIIWERNWESFVYSYDHIIELVSEKWSLLIWKWESAKLWTNALSKINTDELFKNIWESIFSKVEIFENMDMNDIQSYKNEILWYVKNNFSRTLDKSNFLKEFSESKIALLNWLDPTTYKSINDNYQKYKYLMWEDKINYSDSNKDLVLTPSSDSEWYIDLKLQYLKNIWSQNTEAMQSYIINSYNKILDQWKALDIDNISNKLENFTTNTAQKFEEIYFDMNK